MSDFDSLSSSDKYNAVELLSIWTWVKRIGITLLLIVAAGMAGCPAYNVWEQGMTGQAELERAMQNKQIAIEEARALKESAQLKADAEAIRATGVKIANDTIAEGLGGAEGYLRYLFIDTLNSTSCQTIYIPTEAGLPILEARNK